MRALLLFVALATLAACGSSAPPPPNAGLNPRYVRFYESRLPECPVRDVGTVWGRSLRELRRAAISLRAHAVILNRRNPDSTEPYEGSAVVFVREGCYQ